MGKTPTRSRKDVRPSTAPYRRTASEAPPPGATPLAKVDLVKAPAEAAKASVVEPVAPAPLARAAAAPMPVAATPMPVAAAPMPVAAAPMRVTTAPSLSPVAGPATAVAPAPAMFDFAAALQTSLAFADAALAALPHPAEVGAGDPTMLEPPPGPAPAGDARSLRAGDQFALVYRHGAAVVTRRGTLGQRGAWRVVDYPSAALAAHAYALECSRLVGQGFRDLTDR
jgi:hypothetical protein